MSIVRPVSMVGPPMTRRRAAWAIMQASLAVGGQDFFASWLRAAQSPMVSKHEHASHSSAPPEPDHWTSYQPKFFSPDDLRALDSFTAILIPTDETPGAREAHVVPFIDFVVNAAAEYAPEMQRQWRAAMDWLSAQRFASLTHDGQVALLTRMAQEEVNPASKYEGLPTYHLIKDMTVRAFYTSRVGLVDVLEYKGIAYLTEFPACNHPEHHRV